MQIYRQLDELAKLNRDIYLAIGVFDGVHLGHQRVIGQALEDAKAAGGAAVVLTFDPHPQSVLHPVNPPRLITATPHKLRLIEQLGVDACLLQTFDKSFSEISAQQFLELIAAPTMRLKTICVGTRFHFGHDRTGNARLLESQASRFGYRLHEIQSVLTGDGEMISSSVIRQHIQAGNLDRAAAMLGRNFSVTGTVIRGAGIGRQLGYPTANIAPHTELLPPNGVYAVRVGTNSGIANIGLRPTFAGKEATRELEVHLLDFNEDLYGSELEVGFVKKLRDEQKFASPEELQQQIAADERAARSLLR